MTIRRGEPWGTEVPRPDRLRIARTDHELADWVAVEPAGAFAVSGGDLHRTVGAPARVGDPAHRLPIDVLDVETDRSAHLAVAHVVIRRRWWRGPVVFVCNVGHVGAWNVAPRAHPDDGRLDVVTFEPEMRLRDRWEARRRLPTGTHIPHPSISVRTATEWTWSDRAGARVWVDGVAIGERSHIAVTVLPDATAVHV